MVLTRRRFLGASGAALLLPAARAKAAAQAFRRGGAIHTMMNWGALEDGSSSRYLARPFEAPRNVFPAALVRDFARCGFDFIRLTLDAGPFMQLQGEDRDALEEKLLGNLRLFHDAGLSVIVDCHPVEQVEAYSTSAILDDLEGPLFMQYTAAVGRLSGLLGQVRSGAVMLELMNEPAQKDTSHRTQVQVWGAAQLALHDAARRAAPDLPLLLTGADYGGISGLTDLDPSPFAGSDTLFSYHYYMPLSFTHQGLDFGAPEAPASPHVVDLPYPYDALSPEEIIAAVEARIAAEGLDAQARASALAGARGIIDGFLSDAWNREHVESDFSRVANWAADNGIAPERIIMGECGATRRDGRFTGADPVYRRRWLSDVTGAAAKRGFGWAVWEINGREFGIFADGDEDRVDPAIVQALGLAG
jgi:endoglucanase